MIRKAELRDMTNLIELGREFISEGSWGWTYSEENAAKSFFTCINSPECDILISEEDGVLLGAVIVSYENDFQVDNVGDVLEFYVSKAGRGKGVGRELLAAACRWFDEHNCVQVFAKATANITEQGKAFQNLFGKFGFNIFSDVLVRGVK